MMEEAKTGKNRKKRPFKHTKELVRLALNEGWTQTEIAQKCRTQQSVVSAWKKGTKYGTEEQLKPLLEQFGYKLRRTSFKLYRAMDDVSDEAEWHKLEGKIIFSHVLHRELGDGRKSDPIWKLVVHELGGAEFNIVSLVCYVRGLKSPGDEWWRIHQFGRKLSKHQLMELMDEWSVKGGPYRNQNFLGRENLSYLIRATLLNHGYQVEDVVTHPANW